MPVDVRNEFHSKLIGRRATRTLAASVLRPLLARYGLPRSSTVGVVFTDNDQMRLYNKKYMNRPLPTDVLAFPLFEGPPPPGFPSPHLGDIVVSVEQAALQAAEHGHSLEAELRLLLAHGFLHLLGWDDSTPAARRRMDEETRACLKALGKDVVI
ncbi:MAG: hypothetical protein Kow0059_06260 [Candidatus Sumerlaeia bacterium]